MSGGAFRVVGFQLQPNVGVTQVGNAIDPKSDRSKLENAAVCFFFDQRQAERVAIKSDRLLVGVMRTLDRNIRTARKIWIVDVSDHGRESIPGLRQPNVRQTKPGKKLAAA